MGLGRPHSPAGLLDGPGPAPAHKPRACPARSPRVSPPRDPGAGTGPGTGPDFVSLWPWGRAGPGQRAEPRSGSRSSWGWAQAASRGGRCDSGPRRRPWRGRDTFLRAPAPHIRSAAPHPGLSQTRPGRAGQGRGQHCHPNSGDAGKEGTPGGQRAKAQRRASCEGQGHTQPCAWPVLPWPVGGEPRRPQGARPPGPGLGTCCSQELGRPWARCALVEEPVWGLKSPRGLSFPTCEMGMNGSSRGPRPPDPSRTLHVSPTCGHPGKTQRCPVCSLHVDPRAWPFSPPNIRGCFLYAPTSCPHWACPHACHPPSHPGPGTAAPRPGAGRNEKRAESWTIRGHRPAQAPRHPAPNPQARGRLR